MPCHQQQPCAAPCPGTLSAIAACMCVSCHRMCTSMHASHTCTGGSPPERTARLPHVRACRTAPAAQYEFTISWPKRWATKGYTQFMFGFTARDEARCWFSRIAECLDMARARAPTASAAPSGTKAVGGWPHRTKSGNIVLAPTLGGAAEVRACERAGCAGRRTLRGRHTASSSHQYVCCLFMNEIACTTGRQFWAAPHTPHGHACSGQRMWAG
jgi:hypothetical protein